MLVAVANGTGKQPQQGLPNHFDKLMDSPCTNHAYPIKHLYKDYELLKRFLRQAGGPKEEKGKEAVAKKGGVVGKDGDGFPDPEECLMIFGGSDAIYSKRQHKVCYREACVAKTAIPSFLSWSESPITFDQRDHRSHVMRPRRYPLVVDPIVRKKHLTKVLMDGGSGFNILYVDTLDAMRIPRSKLRLVSSPFHGMIPGTQAYTLR